MVALEILPADVLLTTTAWFGWAWTIILERKWFDLATNTSISSFISGDFPSFPFRPSGPKRWIHIIKLLYTCIILEMDDMDIPILSIPMARHVHFHWIDRFWVMSVFHPKVHKRTDQPSDPCGSWYINVNADGTTSRQYWTPHVTLNAMPPKTTLQNKRKSRARMSGKNNRARGILSRGFGGVKCMQNIRDWC